MRISRASFAAISTCDVPLSTMVVAPPTYPMTFWKLTLSYDGTPYHGWQIQPGLATVQGMLAAALEHITGERVLPQGSGRTDAGVHALAQVASFALAAPIPAANLQRALNRSLPQSIRVLRAEQVSADFHARHSAVRKSYEYRIFERRSASETRSAAFESMTAEEICSPFLAPFAWDCKWALRLDRMQQAAAMLCGTHDFTSFAAADPEMSHREEVSAGPNPVKTIVTSSVIRRGKVVLYRVEGSGFLHHMVRNIVGTLVDVGRGSLLPEDMARILAERDRASAGPTAPAQGLFLVQVDYRENSAAIAEKAPQ